MADGDSDETLREFDDESLQYIGTHLGELRRSVSDRRVLRWSLAFGFGLGLAAYIAGYLLKSAVTTEPLRLVSDLLYALGLALWTGVVVVVFAEVIPEAKERQITKVLDAYEAKLRDERRAASGAGPVR
jgi:hypothetical protein